MHLHYSSLTGITDLEKYTADNKFGSRILNPELRLIHRILAVNLSGKNEKDMSAMSRPEIFLLEAMLERRPVNLAYWLAGAFRGFLRSKKIFFGALITKIAHQLAPKNFKFDSLQPYHIPQTLTFSSLDNQGFWNIFDDFLFCEPGFTPPGEQVKSNKHLRTFKYIDIHSEQAQPILVRLHTELQEKERQRQEMEAQEALAAPAPPKKKKEKTVKGVPPQLVIKDSNPAVQTPPADQAALSLTTTSEVRETIQVDQQVPIEQIVTPPNEQFIPSGADAISLAVNIGRIAVQDAGGSDGPSAGHGADTPGDAQGNETEPTSATATQTLEVVLTTPPLTTLQGKAVVHAEPHVLNTPETSALEHTVPDTEDATENSTGQAEVSTTAGCVGSSAVQNEASQQQPLTPPPEPAAQVVNQVPNPTPSATATLLPLTNQNDPGQSSSAAATMTNPSTDQHEPERQLIVTNPAPNSTTEGMDFEAAVGKSFEVLQQWFTHIDTRILTLGQSVKSRFEDLARDQQAASQVRSEPETNNLVLIQEHLAGLTAQITSITTAQTELAQALKDSTESTSNQLVALREDQRESRTSTEAQLDALRKEHQQLINTVKELREVPCPKCTTTSQTPTKFPKPFTIKPPADDPAAGF